MKVTAHMTGEIAETLYLKPNLPLNQTACVLSRGSDPIRGQQPGRYAGAVPRSDEGEPFEETIAYVTTQWREPQIEAPRLDPGTAASLLRLGFGDRI